MPEEVLIPDGDISTICNYAKSLTIEKNREEELEHGFYVYDLGEVHRTYLSWKEYFPNIHPYYAVKCNPDVGLLKELATNGVNFDCASPAEIDIVLKEGIEPSRILYANPCKSIWDIKYAVEYGVTQTTFDTTYELEKIAKYAPHMKCILRLYACDPNAQCQLSNKFGAYEDEWDNILKKAKDLQITLTGISFHVGSGSSSPYAFSQAIHQAKRLYDLGKEYGYELTCIDIGGGFMKTHLSTIPEAIHIAIKECGFDKEPFKIIAEPGRFFAESSGHLFTKVLGIRDRSSTHRDYWISDSLYGSFNCILYDHIHPKPLILKNISKKIECEDTLMQPTTPDKTEWDTSSSFNNDINDSTSSSSSTTPSLHNSDSDSETNYTNKFTKYISTLFGPTCDGMDIVMKDIPLPRLELNDWIVFPNMGAYTIAGACVFNGIGFPFIPKYYVRSQK